MDEPKTYTGNPLHDMEDEELVSRLTLAFLDVKEGRETDQFREYRQELMYRLRRSHIESWTPPARFPKPQVGHARVSDMLATSPTIDTLEPSDASPNPTPREDV